VRRLNRDEVMHIQKLGGCEYFVCQRQELLFDATSTDAIKK